MNDLPPGRLTVGSCPGRAWTLCGHLHPGGRGASLGRLLLSLPCCQRVNIGNEGRNPDVDEVGCCRRVGSNS